METLFREVYWYVTGKINGGIEYAIIQTPKQSVCEEVAEKKVIKLERVKSSKGRVGLKCTSKDNEELLKYMLGYIARSQF